MVEVFILGIVVVAYVVGFVMGHRTGYEVGIREFFVRLIELCNKEETDE